jgi:protease I
MNLLVAIAPERYRDEELDEPLAVFRRTGIGYDIASTRAGPCRGMLGGTAQATLSFAQADPAAYDGLVIIGGAGSPAHLWPDKNLISLVTRFSSAGKLVAAICLAPAVLARAGILDGRKATVFRSPESVAEMKKGGAVLAGTPVVTDGPVITADGPAAAHAFGEAVAAALNR